MALNSDVLVNVILTKSSPSQYNRIKFTVVYKTSKEEQISDVNSVLEIDESDKVLNHGSSKVEQREAYNMSTDIFVVDTPCLLKIGRRSSL